MPLLCKLNFHKWYFTGQTRLVGPNKWNLREHGPGKCERCGLEAEDISREAWY